MSDADGGQCPHCSVGYGPSELLAAAAQCCPHCRLVVTVERAASGGAIRAEMDRLRAVEAAAWRVLEAEQEPREGPNRDPLAAALDGLAHALVHGEFYGRALVAQVSAYQHEIAEVEQTLGRALGYPVAGPEIGGDGVRVFTGEHTPATLAAEAAGEVERLRQRVATLTAALERHGQHDLECSTQGGYNGETALAKCDCGLDAAL